jgi:GNAT superfamily N-acetyltransferase
MSDLVIRDVTAADEVAWRALWDGYCAFYETEMPGRITAAAWRRILDPAERAFGAIVAVREGRVVGFANYVVHPYTWSEQDECLLHDLYVDPEVRGGGIGERLIRFLVERGREERWTRVYWLTKENNARARHLYDRFGPADGFIRYSVPVPAE